MGEGVRVRNARRRITEDERRLLNHVMMFGSDGYPITKVGRKWMVEHAAVRFPVLFKTKREATAAFEGFLDVLIDAKGTEAHVRALRDAHARAVAAGDAGAAAKWRAKLVVELGDDLDEAIRFGDLPARMAIAREIAELGHPIAA